MSFAENFISGNRYDPCTATRLVILVMLKIWSSIIFEVYRNRIRRPGRRKPLTGLISSLKILLFTLFTSASTYKVFLKFSCRNRSKFYIWYRLINVFTFNCFPLICSALLNIRFLRKKKWKPNQVKKKKMIYEKKKKKIWFMFTLLKHFYLFCCNKKQSIDNREVIF